MFSRRHFLQTATLSSFSALSKECAFGADGTAKNNPVVLSIWTPNARANRATWTLLRAGDRSLGAVKTGVQIPESDPADQNVGYGGLPDHDGKVTLDACIMNERCDCGAVLFLEIIRHPIEVARLVMEKTPHVQLVG